MIQPYQSAPRERFSRLLKPTPHPFDPTSMKQLGLEMRRPPTRGETTPPAASYTYFGQFIDHDITKDKTSLAEAGEREPRQTVNGGGGRLDLHHIYGRGPRSTEHRALYASDGASFLLGKEWPNKHAF